MEAAYYLFEIANNFDSGFGTHPPYGSYIPTHSKLNYLPIADNTSFIWCNSGIIEDLINKLAKPPLQQQNSNLPNESDVSVNPFTSYDIL